MTPEAYLSRARALLPGIRERAPAAERLRCLPEATFQEFQDTGLLRGLQPARYGGYELDPGTFLQAGIEIGTVCASSAWFLTVVGVHNWQLGLFPPQAQEEVWGQDTSVQISSALSPTGTVEPVEGGFRLHGRWSFSSGCDWCQWVVLGGVVPSTDAEAPADVRSFLVPRSDYVIDDNWQVMGLCATGSKDIVVEEAFVPEYRTLSYLDTFYLRHPGNAVNPGPLFRLPFGIIFPYALVAPAVGVALGALATFREATRQRINVRDGARVAEDPFVQLRLAEAASDVAAARDSLLNGCTEMMALARAGQPIPLEARARYRWEAAKATTRCVQAVDLLFEASGGRAIFLDNPIQRAWRDVHAIRAHAGNNPDRAALIFGRSALGLPPQELRF
jgi:3-hydroxy-9,10-secoandrosta-1,3,5(10)-triene-9,17-dione monooxygenase